MLGGDVPWWLQNELADGENSRHMADGQRRAPASWVYRAFGDSQGVVSPNSGRRAEAPALCRLIRLGRRAFSIVAHAGILQEYLGVSATCHLQAASSSLPRELLRLHSLK